MSIKPITVADASFTLDASARDCPPQQFVREFTVNSCEAIDARIAMRLPEDHGLQHSVTWRPFTELGARTSVPKLACVDTGSGMSADEIERYINSLASSGRSHGLGQNYGFGAKVAGAVVSPAGLTYLSWTGGPETGVTATLMRDAERGWGLQLDEATLEATMPADPELCPTEIRDAGWRGTVVILHGLASDHDTTQAPDENGGGEWLLKALNTRFYELPDHIEIRVQLTKAGIAHGQRTLLDPHTESVGSVRLSDATVYWRVMKEDPQRRRGKRGSRFAASGHRAALHNGELYDLTPASRGGYRKLQEFGITLGYGRVVIYLEPDDSQPNTVRSHLVMPEATAGKELPWERWADEFGPLMPRQLRDLVDSAIADDVGQDRRDPMRRLREINAQLPIPAYQRDDAGIDHVGPLNHGGPEHTVRSSHRSDTAQRSDRGTEPSVVGQGNLVGLFSRPAGDAARRFDSQQIPDIRCEWVSQAAGTRVSPALEDMAATFLKRSSLLQLSEDFRGFVVLRDYFYGRYASLPSFRAVVDAELKAAYETIIIEYVVGSMRLRSAPYWTPDAEEHVLDDRALTACAMQYPTLVAAVEERLARRLGKTAVAA